MTPHEELRNLIESFAKGDHYVQGYEAKLKPLADRCERAEGKLAKYDQAFSGVRNVATIPKLLRHLRRFDWVEGEPIYDLLAELDKEEPCKQ